MQGVLFQWNDYYNVGLSLAHVVSVAHVGR